MASDYREHLDAAALQLLAETTGFASDNDASELFKSRPNDIKRALGSPKAARLLDLTEPSAAQSQPTRHGLLQIAVAVHQMSEDICQAGWVASDESIIDLELLSFCGQTQHQQFVVGLLASYLQSPASKDFDFGMEMPYACDLARLHSLIDLCGSASDLERAGALRLLGDEALFTASMYPGLAHSLPIDSDILDKLQAVLPKAVVALIDELQPQLKTLLDVYLMFGPIWYRMAAQNVLFSGVRESLGAIATDFATARRFIVRVEQGPLAQIKHSLYPHIG